jgi:hypothetical protein
VSEAGGRALAGGLAVIHVAVKVGNGAQAASARQLRMKSAEGTVCVL